MALCSIEDCQEHLGCRLRKGGGLFQLGKGATETRTRRHKYRPPAQPSWEKGVAGEHRPDGSFMPYLNAERNEMSIKEYSEDRHRVDNVVSQLKRDPNVFADERRTATS